MIAALTTLILSLSKDTQAAHPNGDRSGQNGAGVIVIVGAMRLCSRGRRSKWEGR